MNPGIFIRSNFCKKGITSDPKIISAVYHSVLPIVVVAVVVRCLSLSLSTGNMRILCTYACLGMAISKGTQQDPFNTPLQRYKKMSRIRVPIRNTTYLGGNADAGSSLSEEDESFVIRNALRFAGFNVRPREEAVDAELEEVKVSCQSGTNIYPAWLVVNVDDACAYNAEASWEWATSVVRNKKTRMVATTDTR